jgi:hypothetical protein
MYCGGASVGLNANAKHVVCFENNKKVVELLQTLRFFSEKLIIDKIERFINKFKLSDTFNNGYNMYRKYIQGNNGLNSLMLKDIQNYVVFIT